MLEVLEPRLMEPWLCIAVKEIYICIYVYIYIGICIYICIIAYCVVAAPR